MKLQERVNLFQDRLQQVISHSGLNRSAFAASIRVDRSTLSQLLAEENVRLPDARAGLAMVFEVYEKASYALVLKSNRVLKVGDKVKNP